MKVSERKTVAAIGVARLCTTGADLRSWNHYIKDKGVDDAGFLFPGVNRGKLSSF